MARYVLLLRHTDNDGDQLTATGVEAAVALGASLEGGYEIVVTSGAQRATQTAACILAGLGRPVPGGVVVEPALRSGEEDRWRAAFQAAGGGDLASLQAVDPDLVQRDAEQLAAGLRRTFQRLKEGQRALAIGHSPTNEAAVLGLTGTMVAPLAKGGGVVVIDSGRGYEVAPLE